LVPSHQPSDKIKKLYDININGSFYIAREAAKIMMASKTPGSIILVASMSAGVVNVPQSQAPYNLSKAAVRHMAASLAVEWAKNGIRVNSLSPGYMLTSLTRTVLEQSPQGQELRNIWENLTPMGRMGAPVSHGNICSDDGESSTFGCLDADSNFPLSKSHSTIFSHNHVGGSQGGCYLPS